MVLTACNHNNDFYKFPQSDRIIHRLIYEIIPIVVYRDTRICRLRAIKITSSPIDPFCPYCKSDIIDQFTSMGGPTRTIDAVVRELRRNVNEKAESMKQMKRGGEERGIIDDLYSEVQWCRNIDHFRNFEEVENYLSWALDAGMLDVSETTARPNPASKSAVDELERVDIAVNNDVTTKEDDCVICLEGLLKKETMVVRMPCKHEFHEDCLLQWFSRSHVCPLCRFELPIEDSN